MATRPTNLGVSAGRLLPCPDRPNCVCSQASDAAHAMVPIPLEGSAADAMARLKQIVSKLPRGKIVTASDDYLHVEFTSSLLRFTDDVEFYIDEENSVIHFRSASRVGYTDFGANRQRMEKIVAAYMELPPA